MTEHPGQIYLIHLDEGLEVREGCFARHYIAPRFCPVCVAAREDGRGLLQAHVPELALPSPR